jgi:NADPH:quinone reductase
MGARLTGNQTRVRTILVTRHGAPEVLELQEQPAPEPGPGQLLVDVEAAGVNYRDIYEREGGGTHAAETPHPAGVEGAGTVAAVGDGVDRFAPGDRVAWSNAPGSYAEQVLVAADAAVTVPDGVATEVAAAVMLQGSTAHYLATSTYPIQSGDSVLVHAAAGGVGLLLTQIATRRGGRVIATTSTEEKAELARAAGAGETIGYEGFAERARELTGGEGVAAVYDGIGAATFDESLAALRPRGYMVLYGAASGQPPPVEIARLNAGSLFLTRPTLAHYGREGDEQRMRAADLFAWIAAGELDVRIGGRYPLADAARAQADLASRATTGKLILTP